MKYLSICLMNFIFLFMASISLLLSTVPHMIIGTQSSSNFKPIFLTFTTMLFNNFFFAQKPYYFLSNAISFIM